MSTGPAKLGMRSARPALLTAGQRAVLTERGGCPLSFRLVVISPVDGANRPEVKLSTVAGYGCASRSPACPYSLIPAIDHPRCESLYGGNEKIEEQKEADTEEGSENDLVQGTAGRCRTTPATRPSATTAYTSPVRYRPFDRRTAGLQTPTHPGRRATDRDRGDSPDHQ